MMLESSRASLFASEVGAKPLSETLTLYAELYGVDPRVLSRPPELSEGKGPRWNEVGELRYRLSLGSLDQAAAAVGLPGWLYRDLEQVQDLGQRPDLKPHHAQLCQRLREIALARPDIGPDGWAAFEVKAAAALRPVPPMHTAAQRAEPAMPGHLTPAEVVVTARQLGARVRYANSRESLLTFDGPCVDQATGQRMRAALALSVKGRPLQNVRSEVLTSFVDLLRIPRKEFLATLRG